YLCRGNSITKRTPQPIASSASARPSQRSKRAPATRSSSCIGEGFFHEGARRPLGAHTISQRMAAPSPLLDVVVPVYGAAGALSRCIRSLALQGDRDRSRVLLIADGPQPADVEAVLVQAATDGMTVLREPARGGFVRAANRGIAAAAERDVVLLN